MFSLWLFSPVTLYPYPLFPLPPPSLKYTRVLEADWNRFSSAFLDTFLHMPINTAFLGWRLGLLLVTNNKNLFFTLK